MKAKFFILCDVIFLLKDCRRNLKLVTLGSERFNVNYAMSLRSMFAVKLTPWNVRLCFGRFFNGQQD